MKLVLFSTKSYDRQFFSAKWESKFGGKADEDDEATNNNNKSSEHAIHYFQNKLNKENAHLAKGYDAVCIFVNDEASKEVLQELANGGTKLLLLRCAGFDNVDLEEAKRLGIRVMRVPGYSPSAVAEHAVAMALTLNRKTHKAYARVREFNFSIDGLMGFDMRGKTVGVVGTGKIGAFFAEIMHGFGCNLLGYDIYPDESLTRKFNLKYVGLDELLGSSDIISVHAPLTKGTYHMINMDNITKIKQGAMLINTSRGGLLETKAIIKGLKSKQLGAVGLDVYELENDLFFNDKSAEVIQDDQLTRLLAFPNVLVTGHQAFFTREAFTSITDITFQNLEDFMNNKESKNDVLPPDTKK